MNIDRMVQVAVLILGGGFLILAYVGFRIARASRDLPYFLMRRSQLVRGWRWIALGVVLAIVAVSLQVAGRQIVYAVYPPTASLTATGTETLTPTITQTPTISPTPSITPPATMTYTPTVSTTPVLPDAINVLLQETVTPNPDAAFSEIVFATRINDSIQPVAPSDVFVNPVGRLFGAFSYNNLSDGVRWSAIWLQLDSGILCVESQVWDGGTGGYGYTECEPEAWQPGEYEVQIFFAETWQVSGRFTIEGEPPTTTPSPVPTVSAE